MPYGRKRYVQLLSKYLQNLDKVIFFENTNNVEDLEYLQELAKFPNFEIFRTSDALNEMGTGKRVSHILKHCIDKDTLYIKIDDDIVYIHPNAIQNLIYFTLNNNYAFVSANLINHCTNSHIHMRMGIYEKYDADYTYDAWGDFCWKSHKGAELAHRTFFENNPEKYMFDKWVYANRERWSICFFAFTGKEMEEAIKLDEKRFHQDHELYLSSEYLKKTKKLSAICGTALACHFAYYPQREELDKTDILENYVKIKISDNNISP